LTDFYTWFEAGVLHIADWQAYDHLLFLLALYGIYPLEQWRKLLWLITAFTLGHSLSLALSVSGIVHIKSAWVEFLIPLTIVFTCTGNLLQASGSKKVPVVYTYLAALFFGCIHGLGFSSLLRSLLVAGDSILLPLLGFNLGLELGQALAICGIIIFSLALTRFFHVHEKTLNVFVSVTAMVAALIITVIRYITLIAI
jgi:hypothetical protein